MNQQLTQWGRQVIRLIIFFTFSALTAHAQEVIGPIPLEEFKVVFNEGDSARTPQTKDTIFDFPEELIKDRLAQLGTTIPLHYNEDIRAFIELFTMRKREYVRRVLTQQSFYFPIFEAELQKNNKPLELTYLSVVESALNPKAVSRAGAVGLWQFMPYTGRESGLYQDANVDERMDIYKSTRAACAYLKMLHSMFSDWELAMAAYNCGPGAVRRAIRRAGNKTSFWEIYPYLPRETRSYVPIYVATTYVMKFHQEYLFSIDSPRPYVESDTVHVTQPIDLQLLANELAVPIETIKVFNPHLKKGVVPAYLKNYPLRLPVEKALVLREYKTDMFLAASRNQTPAASEPSFDATVLAASASTKRAEVRKKAESAVSGRKKVTYTVASGDVLGRIADLYDVGISELRRWNNLRGNTIRAGQELAVWVQTHTWKRMNKVEKAKEKEADEQTVTVAKVLKNSPAVKENSIDKKSKTLAMPKNNIYEVQPGDTLWSISRKRGVDVGTLKKLNNLRTNNLKAGQKLIVG